jgi:hypothetical protein
MTSMLVSVVLLNLCVAENNKDILIALSSVKEQIYPCF